MILRYGGSNFFCFKEDFEIDLRLNKNCPEDISAGNDYSKIMCIKGANAAGKTNALKALSFIASFITESFNRKPTDKINIETYFGNKRATYLFCEFRVCDVDYRYDVTIRENAVTKEKLTLISEPDNHLFIRVKNKVNTENPNYASLLDIPQIRANASLISIANQHEIACIIDIYKLFRILHSNVSYTGHNELWNNDGISELYFEHPEVLDFVKKQLKKFDTGILDVEIDFFENVEGDKVYFPLFSFKVDGIVKKLRINYQSSGTGRLYKLLAFFAMATLSKLDEPISFTLVLDELDLHLHSFIIPELIQIIEKSKNVQLIFTCQNDHILDQMGKYRTTLINKDENESYSYRLDELPSDLLRNNRPITPHYKKGSIGGVPNIEEEPNEGESNIGE